MRYEAHTEVMGEYRIRIVSDEDPQNPRTDCDGHAGKMICWHNRYNLGDKEKEYDDIEEFQHVAEKEGFFVLPLYLYDHSGITMSTGAFSCPWDSGQVGFIYCKPFDALEYFGIKIDLAAIPDNPDVSLDDYRDLGKTAQARVDASYKRYRKFYLKLLGKENVEILLSHMKGEVETYDHYLTGNVYGYIVEEKIPYEKKNLKTNEVEQIDEWEEVDSCWGFYGDYEKGALEEARSIVKHLMEKETEKEIA